METIHIKAHSGISDAQIQSIAFTPAKSVQSSLTPIAKQQNMTKNGSLPQASAPYLVNLQINQQMIAETEAYPQTTVVGLLLQTANTLPWHIIKPALFFMTGCLLMMLWFHG